MNREIRRQIDKIIVRLEGIKTESADIQSDIEDISDEEDIKALDRADGYIKNLMIAAVKPCLACDSYTNESPNHHKQIKLTNHQHILQKMIKQ